MTTDTESRLRFALSATANQLPVPGDAFARNSKRIRDDRRRRLTGTGAAAAVAAMAVVATPLLSGDADTLESASPGSEGSCGVSGCPPAEDRRTGDPLETFPVAGSKLALFRQDATAPVYTLCAKDSAGECGRFPATEHGTAVAVPTADGGALLVFGLRDNGPAVGDRVTVRLPGQNAPVSEPPVTLVNSSVLGYDLAVLAVPTFEKLYCVDFTNADKANVHLSVIGVNDHGQNCA